MEPFPGHRIEELTPSAEWSMNTCLTVLIDSFICLGNCQGQISVFSLDSYCRDGLLHCRTLQTSARSKVHQLAGDPLQLVAADSTGKIWSWSVGKAVSFDPVLKGVATNMNTLLLNTMVLTEFFICLGYGNGTMRLLCRDTGSVYCDVYAHAAALTAMAYNSSSQVLVSVGEDGLIRAWAIDEKQEECKIKYLQHEVVDDLMLCGVQFLNEGGTIFGVVGYDRNEIITYKA